MLIVYMGLLIGEGILIYTFWKKVIQQRVKSNHKFRIECKKLLINVFRIYRRTYNNEQFQSDENLKLLLDEAKRITLEIIVWGSVLLVLPLVGSGLIYYQSTNEEVMYKIFWDILVCGTLGWSVIKKLTEYEDRIVENIYLVWQINRLSAY